MNTCPAIGPVYRIAQRHKRVFYRWLQARPQGRPSCSARYHPGHFRRAAEPGRRSRGDRFTGPAAVRLNSIKLSGFKSFAEPTNFMLPGQLVGVVGPNGCGKSNIMDAVRWGLGESKASELRGESM